MKLGVLLSVLLPLAAYAQDERRVISPDGKLEFRVFVAPQPENSIVRIAYQVFYRGTAVINTSFLALDIWDQEPLLGESTGLVSSHAESHPDYNSLTACYMQNGSLGRLLNIEARAYSSGIAFRYVIPKSTPLRELLISDESTEFALPKPSNPPPSLPFVFQEPGSIWLEIAEVPVPNFPAMHLVHGDDDILLSRLAQRPANPRVTDNFVYEGTTPLTLPWRVILVGPTRESLSNTVITDLSK